MSRLFLMPNAALLLAAASVGSLLFALTMQFGFNIQPCELCLWQRVPFVVVAALAFLALIARPLAPVLLQLAALALLANAGLALFHSGVERHWWEWHSACTGGLLDHAGSIDELRHTLLDKPVVRCDEISWSIFGLTMANLNIGFSFVLAAFAGLAAIKAGRKR